MTERVVTRFRPTSGNGPLHVGHLVNAYCSWMFARRHGGEFLIICDPMYLTPGEFQDFPPDEIWPVYRENWELLGRLFPRVKRINTALNSGLMQRMLSIAIGEEVRSFLDPFMRATAFDFLLGVNVLFRGRDWDARSNYAISDQLDYDYVYRCYLERWRKQVTPVHYTPLLVDRQRHKLSKRRKQLSASLTHVEKRGVAHLSMYAYVASLIAGEQVTEVAELLRFHERFDPAALEEQAFYVYDEAQLLAIDEAVRANVRALAGEDDAAPTLIDTLYADLIAGPAACSSDDECTEASHELHRNGRIHPAVRSS